MTSPESSQGKADYKRIVWGRDKDWQDFRIQRALEITMRDTKTQVDQLVSERSATPPRMPIVSGEVSVSFLFRLKASLFRKNPRS